MNKTNIIKLMCVLSVQLALLAVFVNYSDAAYKQGDSGSAGRTIQSKLKNWGYYKGNVDGIFGSKTKQAVISFQKKNGLTADGVVGKATLKALGMPTGGSTDVVNNYDHYLRARMISAEA